MSLSEAAKALGIPEPLVQRSAEARAAETGATVEEILAAWAGGEQVAGAAPPQAEPEPAGEEPAAEPGAAAGKPAAEEPAAEESPAAPAPAAPVPAAPPTRAPVPAEVTLAEAARLPEVVTVPTAGIRERTNFVMPKWLTLLMIVAPLFALFALGSGATGSCGEATELEVDVITGEIVNCDGSEFTGGGAGGGATDFVALGGEIYSGAVTPAATCAGCHGASGQGSGAFPPLTGVLTTFGACADHLEWVRLGSAGWAATNGPTYGDTDKTVDPGMPGHEALSDEQLRSVVAFERVRFGGAPEEETLADCGLVEGEQPAESEGGAPPGEEGQAPPDDGSTTTAPGA